MKNKGLQKGKYFQNSFKRRGNKTFYHWKLVHLKIVSRKVAVIWKIATFC